MRKVELLPTRDCEAGYGPESEPLVIQKTNMNMKNIKGKVRETIQENEERFRDCSNLA